MCTGNEEVLEHEVAVRCSAAVDLEAQRGVGAHVGLDELEEQHKRSVVQRHVAEAHAARRALTPPQPALPSSNRASRAASSANTMLVLGTVSVITIDSQQPLAHLVKRMLGLCTRYV